MNADLVVLLGASLMTTVVFGWINSESRAPVLKNLTYILVWVGMGLSLVALIMIAKEALT